MEVVEVVGVVGMVGVVGVRENKDIFLRELRIGIK
jgi:hypothetical protein